MCDEGDTTRATDDAGEEVRIGAKRATTGEGCAKRAPRRGVCEEGDHDEGCATRATTGDREAKRATTGEECATRETTTRIQTNV